MDHFHVWKKFKSILLVALSVAILVCSIPFTSFKSSALEAYAISYASDAYLALVSYLLTRGYSAPKLASSEGDLLVNSYRVTGYDSEILDSFLNGIKTLNLTMYAGIQRALVRAAQTGKLVLTSEQDDFLKSYFDSLTVDSSMVVGHSSQEFYPLSAGTPFNFSFSYFYNSSSNVVKDCDMTIVFPFDCLPVVDYTFNNDSLYAVTVYAIPLEKTTSSSSFDNISITYSDDSFPQLFSFGSMNLSSVYGRIAQMSVFTDYSTRGLKVNNFSFGSYLKAVGITSSVLIAITDYLRTNGFFKEDVEATANQVVDTSDIDVLSTATEIDPATGEASGGLTLYLPDTQSLIDLLQDFYDQVISWTSAIKQLGLSQVASDATVAQKENALDKVAVPDSTYDWLTSTLWGSETITQTNEDIQTQTQAQSDLLENTATQYGSNDNLDEDNDNKGGLAMLIGTLLLYLGLWHSPNYDPTAPDPGGLPDDEQTAADRSAAADVIAGVGVAATLVSSIFDSAGGSSRYGMIFTVGASFVLFSVIIGAGHFLGGLGNSAEVKAKAADREVVRETHRNNLANSQLKLEMTQRRYNKGK